MKTPKFSPVVKDRLFYNQYRYCISFFLDELSCLKMLDHDYIDTVINRRREWRAIHHQSFQKTFKTNTVPAMRTILGRRYREISEETVENLHALADQLLNVRDDFKLVTSVDQGWVYTNSRSLVRKLWDNLTLTHKHCTEAVIDRPPNTIRLKNSQYRHRSYFKIVKMTTEQKDNIERFFINQQSNIRPSPALLNWFNGSYCRTQDYFFVDHNGDGWLLMLSLVHSGLIRKTVDIIQG